MIVVPTTEVEGNDRVHHLILLPDYETGRDLADTLSPFSKNIGKNGRPQVKLSGEDIASRVHDLDGMIGPAHAFTPWTSLYASHNSVASCYGDEPIDLLELGLSADSGYGSRIADLAGVPFLSPTQTPTALNLRNSGVSSPGLRINSVRPDTADVLDAIKAGTIVMNAGFFPEEGKYNRTACTRCFTPYSLSEAEEHGWKCPLDKGRIKKGVRDRAEELSSGPETRRPPYLHIIPLAEIIQRTLKTCSPTTKKCSDLYQRCLVVFGDEISVLTETPVDDLLDFHPGSWGCGCCIPRGKGYPASGWGRTVRNLRSRVNTEDALLHCLSDCGPGTPIFPKNYRITHRIVKGLPRPPHKE